jgi:arylsulfatase A-like enzyme
LAAGQGQDDIEIVRALYDGELNYLDQQIGTVVQFLQSAGILDETMLVITSDHGDCLGEHNQVGHRMALYEQLLHVPMIIRHPTYFHAGERIKQQVSLIDLHPTCLALAGVPAQVTDHEGFQNLLQTNDPGRPNLFSENTAPKSMNSLVSRSVRTPHYKYIWNSNQAHELYDLPTDPEESVNLFYDETDSVQKVGRQLAQTLDLWQNRFGQQQVETMRAEYEDVVLERLRDLGYVE